MLVTVLAKLTFQERTVNVDNRQLVLCRNLHKRWTQLDKMTYNTEMNSVLQQAMLFNLGVEILWIVASLWRQYLK